MVAIAQNPSVWFQGTEQQPCQFLKAGSTLAWFQNQKVIRPLARERPDLATAKASQAKLDRARSGQRPPGNRWCNIRACPQLSRIIAATSWTAPRKFRAS